MAESLAREKRRELKTKGERIGEWRRNETWSEQTILDLQSLAFPHGRPSLWPPPLSPCPFAPYLRSGSFTRYGTVVLASTSVNYSLSWGPRPPVIHRARVVRALKNPQPSLLKALWEKKTTGCVQMLMPVFRLPNCVLTSLTILQLTTSHCYKLPLICQPLLYQTNFYDHLFNTNPIVVDRRHRNLKNYIASIN